MKVLRKIAQVIVKFLKTPLYLGWALAGYLILFCTVLVALDRSAEVDANRIKDAEYDVLVDQYLQDFTIYQVCLALNEAANRGDQKWDYVLEYFLQIDPGNQIVKELQEGLKEDLAPTTVGCILPIRPERQD